MDKFIELKMNQLQEIKAQYQNEIIARFLSKILPKAIKPVQKVLKTLGVHCMYIQVFSGYTTFELFDKNDKLIYDDSHLPASFEIDIDLVDIANDYVKIPMHDDVVTVEFPTKVIELFKLIKSTGGGENYYFIDDYTVSIYADCYNIAPM